jgi:septal ring factor EnvC (AmiA/AmiB activator)
MNRLVPLIVLAVLALALGIGLLVCHQKSVEQQKQDLAVIVSTSNKLKQTSLRLDEAQGVIANLEKDVNARDRAIGGLSIELLSASNTLARTTGDLGAARQAIKEAQDEITRRDARIGALETENNNLDKRASELTNAIVGLNMQIAETQRKLAAAEGDKAFLETQLKRLMADKADLEKKFSDLEVLRAQIKQLKEDLVIARRIEWVRKGLFADPSVKGAQRLMLKGNMVAPPPTATNYDLNVEVHSDGSARGVPPPAATNAPPPR